MVPPENVKVTETSTSIYWFDGDGILCAVSKKVPAPSLEETRRIMDELKEMLGGKQVCLLIDVTNSGESTRESRDYAAIEFPKVVKAMALISGSELGKMLANLFLNLKQQPYPTKMFTGEKEAKEWLKQYL
ncbi:MAG: hypothetical protein JWO09_2953 [Bacteroidetes bacterium]|nr:hypothetical protein [Bacteroidota bacterium]